MQTFTSGGEEGRRKGYTRSDNTHRQKRKRNFAPNKCGENGEERERKELIALVHPVIYQGVATKHLPPSPLFPNSWVGPALGANFPIIYFSRPFRGERKGGRYSNFPTR